MFLSYVQEKTDFLPGVKSISEISKRTTASIHSIFATSVTNSEELSWKAGQKVDNTQVAVRENRQRFQNYGKHSN